MLVLVPSVRHTDREGEVCDYNSWRQVSSEHEVLSPKH